MLRAPLAQVRVFNNQNLVSAGKWQNQKCSVFRAVAVSTHGLVVSSAKNWYSLMTAYNSCDGMCGGVLRGGERRLDCTTHRVSRII